MLLMLTFNTNSVLGQNYTQIANISGNITIDEVDFYENITISYNIKLKNGNFTPDPKNGSEINYYFKSLNLTEDFIYVLVQFDTNDGDPTQNQTQNLTNDNVTLISGLVEHTHIAKFPRWVLENKSYDFVRWRLWDKISLT